MSDRYIDTNGIGALLSVEPRTARDRYVRLEGFPRPRYLPAGKRGESRKRWLESEVIDWFERINSA